MRRFILIFFGVTAAIACSSGGFISPPPSDDIAVPVESGTPDHTLGSETSTIDAGPKFNGGGPFTCSGCICDGTLNMCASGFGGGGAPTLLDGGDASDDAPDDADDDASDGNENCPPEDAGNGCVSIPLACFPQPSCACILETFPGCECQVEPSGNGLFLICPPAP